MIELNLQIGWIAILAGLIAGAVQGSFFQDENWLGGYNSWKRRMTRLGHISFIGLAIINILFYITVKTYGINNAGIVSVLFVISQISMPTVCYITAFVKPFRHLFFIPVLSAVIGTALLVKELMGC